MNFQSDYVFYILYFNWFHLDIILIDIHISKLSPPPFFFIESLGQLLPFNERFIYCIKGIYFVVVILLFILGIRLSYVLFPIKITRTGVRVFSETAALDRIGMSLGIFCFFFLPINLTKLWLIGVGVTRRVGEGQRLKLTSKNKPTRLLASYVAKVGSMR